MKGIVHQLIFAMAMALVALVVSLSSSAQTLPKNPLHKIRWAYPETRATNLAGVLAEINWTTGNQFVVENFQLFEEKPLSGMNFKFYQQYVDQLPVKNAGVRIWTDATNGAFIQMVAYLQNPETQQMLMTRKKINLLNYPLIKESRWSMAAVLDLVQKDLKRVVNFTQDVHWDNERLVSEVVVFGRDRKIIFKFDALTYALLDKKIQLFPRVDSEPDREWTVFGKAYTINEEYDAEYGRRFSEATPETVELKYLKPYYYGTAQDWSPLLAQKTFFESKYDEAKAATPEGIAEGYWSEKSVQKMVDDVTKLFPRMNNQTASGARFIGRYVTVNVDPTALTFFEVQNFSKKYSTFVSRNWSRVNENGIKDWKLTLIPSVYGNTFTSSDELFGRRVEFELVPSTKRLIEDGFDEMQVYFSVNTWFEVLHGVGFNDPELSTRPIIANLFNPDIESRDNAFYDSDTINFTTYTERNPNEARSLITVWHELGHGLMDRLQGSSGFSNGGLSEGIADFAAEVVLRGFHQGELHPAFLNRRINNRTGFSLTNESHDDGEAYGGSLKDILEQSIQNQGLLGYRKASDLVLTAMRLTRRFADLSLNEWYEALLLADRLGKAGLRQPNEFASVIATAFASRNFVPNQEPSTAVNVYFENAVINDDSRGSRYDPVVLEFMDEPESPGQKEMSIQLKLEKLSGYEFPLKVKVSFKETNSQQGSANFLDEADRFYQLNSVNEVIEIPFALMKNCDFANTDNGSCKDFVNIYVYANGDVKPFAKKRFYVQLASAKK